jgi:hypothetical protein
MGKSIILTENDLVKLVKKIIKEENEYDELFDYVEPYIESGCVTIKHSGDWLVFDIESPGYFEWKGFNKNVGLKIKDKLRKKGFVGRVGEWFKKIK